MGFAQRTGQIARVIRELWEWAFDDTLRALHVRTIVELIAYELDAAVAGTGPDPYECR